MAEVSKVGWSVIGILIDKHEEKCTESGCLAKSWDKKDRISALMVHLLQRCVDTSLHGSEEAAMRSAAAIPEALDLFMKAAAYEVERDAEEEEENEGE